MPAPSIKPPAADVKNTSRFALTVCFSAWHQHRAFLVLPTAALRVFVVDDEEIIASTVAAILRMNGFSATAFTSPLQALSSAKVESPDLLISDVVMPGMSGVDLALRIKEECPDCTVLLFSGQAATREMLSKVRHLGNDFRLLLKPIHPADLLCEVRNRLQLRNFPSSTSVPN